MHYTLYFKTFMYFLNSRCPGYFNITEFPINLYNFICGLLYNQIQLTHCFLVKTKHPVGQPAGYNHLTIKYHPYFTTCQSAKNKTWCVPPKSRSRSRINFIDSLCLSISRIPRRSTLLPLHFLLIVLLPKKSLLTNIKAVMLSQQHYSRL